MSGGGVFPVPLPKVFSDQSASVSRSSTVLDIPFFKSYLSYETVSNVRSKSTPVADVSGLSKTSVGAEDLTASPAALSHLCRIYEESKADLKDLLESRVHAREFIDQRVRACYELNYSLNIPFGNAKYQTMLGSEDTDGRVVLGPSTGAASSEEAKIAELPSRLSKFSSGPIRKADLSVRNLSDFSIPSFALLFNGQPLPAHIVDLVLHLFENWNNEDSLTYYASGINNEEDAKYLRALMGRAEEAVKMEHSDYALGSARIFVAIETPRAVFRVNEIATELYPYFAGAVLDWNLYVAASIRIFREDPNYQLPVNMGAAEPQPIVNFLSKASGEVNAGDVAFQKTMLLFGVVSPNEARYSTSALQSNVAACFQFLMSWLSGIDADEASPVSSMAALDAARWQLWHGIKHRRIQVEDLLSAALEEFTKARKSNSSEMTGKWGEVALHVLIQLVSAEKPCESAMELLLPFRVEFIRESSTPLETIRGLDAEKFTLEEVTERFCHYYRICGNTTFASYFSLRLILDIAEAERLFNVLSDSEIEAVNNFQQSPIQSSSLRADLWTSISIQLCNSTMYQITERLKEALKKHSVTGASVAISAVEGVCQAVSLGEATRGVAPVTEHTRFEIASLSKSIGSCFAIEYFGKRNIDLSTPVNKLLADYGSSYRIPSGDSASPEWGDAVTVAQLMDHSALNMHYVNGIPLADDVPSVLDLITGSLFEKYGYSAVCAPKEPGSAFGYSGGGFLVLQHLIEVMEGKDIVEITKPFIDRLGMTDFTFEQKSEAGHEYATAYRGDGEIVPGGRRMHPAFPAGGMGTAMDVLFFLTHLTQAFNTPSSSCPIDHDTAVQMLSRMDKGSQKFMGASMGLGIFIAEAGANKLVIHQGANDGFRCLFAHCYHGPDRGKGFVVHVNAELNGVIFISEIAQILFHELKFSGIDETKFKKDFLVGNIPSEQIVNMGYKELVFNAFERDNAEPILIKGPKDPWADFNLAVGGIVKEVTNERFARAENMLSPMLPTFEPKLFGRQGKVMDSWESVRHNPKPFDTLVFELKTPSQIHFVSVSTQFHLGNQAQKIAVSGKVFEVDEWDTIVPQSKLEGHSKLLISSVNDASKLYSLIRVDNIPDGGISRLGLYSRDSLGVEHHDLFKPPGVAESVAFTDRVPSTVKPLAPQFESTPTDIQAMWDAIPSGCEVDLASSALGGAIWSASDEHYGPAKQVISPYPPLSMFDGLETARSRVSGHYEDIVVKLARKSQITRIEIDMTYFVNNNPLDAAVLASCGDLTEWTTLVPRKRLKAYAGNFVDFNIESQLEFTHVKVMTFPDGGFNRLKIYGKKI